MSDVVDIKSILTDLGYSVQGGGDFLRIQGLFRGGSGYNLSVARDGTVFDFVENKKFSLAEFIKINNGTISAENIANATQTNQYEEIKLEKKYNLEILNHLKFDYKYWNNRGISDETCQKYQCGTLSYNTFPQLNGRSIFPIFNLKNNIIGFAGRSLDDKYTPKWKILGVKSNFIYNHKVAAKSIKEKDSIIIVEGISDLLALSECGIDNSLCLFGVSLSSSIINYLVGLNIDKVIIATNNDTKHNVGQDAAIKIQRKLKSYFDNVEIRLPIFKDIGDMLIENKEQINEIYQN